MQTFNAVNVFLWKINRSIAIADPSLLEERRSEATVVFGINSYRELCGLHFGGITLASLEVLIKCANQGAKRANAVVKQIKAALESDEKQRSASERVGFIQSLQSDSIDLNAENRLFIRLPNFKLNPTDEIETENEELINNPAKIKSLGEHSAILMPAEELSSEDEFADNWIPDLDGDMEMIETNELVKDNGKGIKRISNERMSDDSEEDDTFVMSNLT